MAIGVRRRQAAASCVQIRHSPKQIRIPCAGPRQIEDASSGWPVFNHFQELTDMHNKISKEPTILRRPQVQQRTGLSRSTLYQYIRDGEFPASISLGPRAVGWLESDVSDWISARVKLTHQGQQPTAR
jgi:prophage regulatory protein